MTRRLDILPGGKGVIAQLVRPPAGLPSEADVRAHAALVTGELERLARLEVAFENLSRLAWDLSAQANTAAKEALDASIALKELREQHMSTPVESDER